MDGRQVGDAVLDDQLCKKIAYALRLTLMIFSTMLLKLRPGPLLVSLKSSLKKGLLGNSSRFVRTSLTHSTLCRLV